MRTLVTTPHAGAAQFMFGQVAPETCGLRFNRQRPGEKKRHAFAPGFASEAVKFFACRAPVIGAPDKRGAARQCIKRCFGIGQPLRICNADQRHEGACRCKAMSDARGFHCGYPYVSSDFCVMKESKASVTGNTSLDDTAATRLDAINARIAEATQNAGRAFEDVTLVAVSKTFDETAILPLIAEGQRVFGENRVQEAARKWPALREQYSDIELHLIGPLQTNKVEDALALFDVIHTLDRDRLALALVRAREKGAVLPRLLVQVNTGEEPQKAGLLPGEVDAFLARCRDEWRLEIEGLMCIPPADEEPALHFALLEKLARRNGLRGLSMGMSGDFEKAIALGATYVRVGSALFGMRD